MGMTKESIANYLNSFEPIQGHPNYSVSPSGQIRNDKTGRILKEDRSCRGYAKVNLDGEKMYVHRLVAEHYIPKTDDAHDQIMHRDGDLSNNAMYNLEWTDSKRSHDVDYRYSAKMKSLKFQNYLNESSGE